jgi:hypothetical protein
VKSKELLALRKTLKLKSNTFNIVGGCEPSTGMLMGGSVIQDEMGGTAEENPCIHARKTELLEALPNAL